MAIIEETMFREYDLRGRVSDAEINPASIRLIAQAYGTMLQKRGIKTAVSGYDLRTGSKEFAEIAVNALSATGVDVIFLGQVLTPILYSAQYYFQSRGGMMLTASHNPNGWLGFKLALDFSYTFNSAEMQELRQLTIAEDFISGNGKIHTKNYLPIYTEDILRRVNIHRPVRVLINAGNGTAGPIVPDILRAAGCEVFEFLTEPDLDFKHYFPNPALEKMMQDTGEQTVLHNAEIGFAIDGDGDRLGVTDEKGKIIWPDRYLILLSREILIKNPGAPIIFDMKCSRALSQDILEHGGKPVLWKTGHSYIKEKLHSINSPLGGEMSGHIFYGKPLYYGFDDGVFTALKIIELLSSNHKPLSDSIANTPTYYSTPTLQAQCADRLKYQVVSEIVQGFKDKGFNVFTFEDIRLGGRIEFADGWGLIRASSNLPVLVLRFEAVSQDRLDAIEKMFRQILASYPDVSQEWETG